MGRSTFILLVLGALTACAYIGPPPAVPPPRTERVPEPPPATVTLIWQPGHYDWDGYGYRWIPGEWVPRAGHGTLWQDGIWRQSPNGWVWQPAHWL